MNYLYYREFSRIAAKVLTYDLNLKYKTSLLIYILKYFYEKVNFL
jgi:hypothetical protein